MRDKTVVVWRSHKPSVAGSIPAPAKSMKIGDKDERDNKRKTNDT